MPAPVAGPAPAVAALPAAGARAAAEEFEAVFLAAMLEPVLSRLGEGPFGGGAGASVWRSMLTAEYAKSFARAGGIGIADQVYRTLIDVQAGRTA
jgi:flagellar protein FlgJ